MSEPVEIRIRPHHYDGDVLVGHVEFPVGIPGVGGTVQGGYAFAGWTHTEGYIIPNDGNPYSIPLGVDSMDLVQGFDVDSGDTRLNSPAGMYLAKVVSNVVYENVPPATGFVDVQLVATWADADNNEMTDTLVDIELSSPASPEDPVFDAPLAGVPTIAKIGIGVMPDDGRIELMVYNSTDLPLKFQGQLVVGRL